MTGLVVIDGDLIGFKAAAACETRTIDVYKGEDFVGNFKHRTEFKASIAGGDTLFEDFTIQDKQEVESLPNCLHTVKAMIQGIKEACGVSEVKVVVQGDGNFRDELLLPTKYKGARVGNIKPLLLSDCRNYLIRQFKAELANGQESDDVLAAYAYEGFTNKKYIVQASTDKDANSNVGYLYNWDKMDKPVLINGLGELVRDSKGKVSGTGRKWFYHQILFGDRADSYIPYELSGKRFGEKASFDILNCLTTDKECWQSVYDTYKLWYPEPFEYTAWNEVVVQGSALQQMQMYIDCAHMRRFGGDTPDRVVAEDVLTKLGVKYA